MHAITPSLATPTFYKPHPLHTYTKHLHLLVVHGYLPRTVNIALFCSNKYAWNMPGIVLESNLLRCTVYTVHCILSNVHRTKRTMQNILRILFIIHCTMYNIHIQSRNILIYVFRIYISHACTHVYIILSVMYMLDLYKLSLQHIYLFTHIHCTYIHIFKKEHTYIHVYI